VRTLVAVTLYGGAKDYVLPQFVASMQACVLPVTPDVVVFGDHPLPSMAYVACPPPGGRGYAEDMLTTSRTIAREYALHHGYDQIILHGVDALWQRQEHYRRFVLGHQDKEIRAPLISARANSYHAVARSFVVKDGEYTEEQVDVPDEITLGGVPARIQGFPGADNILIQRAPLEAIDFGDHDPWYVRQEQGRELINVEENWCLKAVRAGYSIWLMPDIKVWHVHDLDHIARIYKGVEIPLSAMPTNPETWETWHWQAE